MFASPALLAKPGEALKAPAATGALLAAAMRFFEGVKGEIERFAEHPAVLIGESCETCDCFRRRLDVELNIAAGPPPALHRGLDFLRLRP